MDNKTSFGKLRYLIMLKSNVSVIYSPKYKKIKINSDDDLLLQKALIMQRKVILIKSVFNVQTNNM